MTAATAQADRIGRAQQLLLLKSVLLIGLLLAFYAFLWRAQGYLEGFFGTVGLAITVVAIAANVSHDAVHSAFSRTKSVNELALFTLDVFGVNGALWRIRHLQHHRFPNLVAVDPDLDTGDVIRLQPSAPYRRFHRFQGAYAWIVYALSMLKLQLFDDLQFIGRGEVGARRFEGRRARLALRSVIGKTLFVGWAIVLPLSVHSATDVILAFLLGWAIVGLSISALFQVAHCVDLAGFTSAWPAPLSEQRRLQIEHTANFRVSNTVIRWFAGGLDRQIEHHLTPSVPHLLLYRDERLSTEEAGLLRAREFPSLWAALRAHYAFLARLGKQVVT
jgi:linoleoyl-CoA desaturase